MHISIEGLDGVGKTTISKMLANELNFTFIEKPLRAFWDDEEVAAVEHSKMIKKITRLQEDGFYRMWFFAFVNVFLKANYPNENVITDRYYCSTYLHNGNSFQDEIMELVMKKYGKPDMTIVLYASAEERKNRLIGRDPSDKDIHLVGNTDHDYNVIRKFIEKFSLPYLWIDTTNLSLEDTLKQIIQQLQPLVSKRRD